MGFQDAFETLLSRHKRVMTITRGASSQSVNASPSNYTAYGAAPSEMVVEGHEFVIPVRQLAAPFMPIKRGDRLLDSQLGTLAIEEVREMYDLGGAIIGFRVRTG